MKAPVFFRVFVASLLYHLLYFLSYILYIPRFILNLILLLFFFWAMGFCEKEKNTANSVEKTIGADTVPGTKQVIYSFIMDGKYIDHIYLRCEDGKVTDLTPTERKTRFMCWSLDKKALFYTSNTRDEQFFDVYKMSIGDWKSNMIYQNNEGMDIKDISEDGTTLALQHTNVYQVNQVLLYDMTAKKMTELILLGQRPNCSYLSLDSLGTHISYSTDIGEYCFLIDYDIFGRQIISEHRFGLSALGMENLKREQFYLYLSN